MAQKRRNKTRPRPVKRPATHSAQARPDGERRQKLAPDWWLVGLGLFGMVLTAYLTFVALSGSDAAFCSGGSGCDIVQQSRWSTLLGVPIALWGFAVYAVITLSAAFMKPRLKRWKRLWYVSLAGLVVSLYLTIVGIVALGAVCLWCLASLATITALFLCVALRRPESAPGMPWRKWWLQSGVAAVVIIALLPIGYSDLIQSAEDPRLKALAIHLQESGAKFYGAFWCPHCNDQKELFGASADRLPYIECTPDGRNGVLAFVCIRKEIRGYPTWIINQQRYQRVLQPQELARYSGFDWGKDSSAEQSLP